MPAGGGVTFHLEAASFQARDNGRFAERVERATDMAAYNAARQGASEARGIYAGSGLRWPLSFDATGGGGSWEIACTGQWAEAQEFGIPGHDIDTEKYSLFKRGVFPTIIGPNGRPIQVQHVDHPGVDEVRAIETAGDIIANEFEGILISYLP